MDATILRLNRDMIARFRGWLSMLSYEGGKSGGPALGRTSTFCSSAFKDFRKVCIRLSAPCLHLEMVHLPVFTSGKARPLKAACSGAVREFISLGIFRRQFVRGLRSRQAGPCPALPALCTRGPYTNIQSSICPEAQCDSLWVYH